VVRQTLSGSDYGLIDDRTLEPNPSYWASWLWRNLMGRRALTLTARTLAPAVRAYAHCARAGGPLTRPGAITLLLVNVDPDAAAEVDLGEVGAAQILRLEADGLGARIVRLNGRPLRAYPDGTPPALGAFVHLQTGARALTLPPLSVAFVVLPDAAAPACAE
jgi:hypothetical protein